MTITIGNLQIDECYELYGLLPEVCAEPELPEVLDKNAVEVCAETERPAVLDKNAVGEAPPCPLPKISAAYSIPALWFIGLEPKGDCKPSPTSNWPKPKPFSLGSRLQYTTYEKHCQELARMWCDHLQWIVPTDPSGYPMLRANMFPLELPRHTAKAFQHCGYDTLTGLSFDDYMNACINSRLKLFTRFMLREPMCRILIFQGAHLEHAANQLAGTSGWQGVKGFQYTCVASRCCWVLKTYHPAHGRWWSIVKNEWALFLRSRYSNCGVSVQSVV